MKRRPSFNTTFYIRLIVLTDARGGASNVERGPFLNIVNMENMSMSQLDDSSGDCWVIGDRAAADPQYTNRCPHPTHGVNTKLGWVLLVIRRHRHRSPGQRVKHSKWWRNGVSICTEMFEFDNLDIENVSCYLWIPKVTHFNQINNIKHGPFWSWCDGRTGTHVLPTLLFW